MSAMKTVWVHGWEVPGSVGFDWFHKREDALNAYNATPVSDDRADFFTLYVTEAGEAAEQTTSAIDSEIDYIIATAATRRVGKNILAYWQENNMDMGTATEPAIMK